jgi:hypothetical protein
MNTSNLQMDIVSLLGHGFAAIAFIGLLIFLSRRARLDDASWMLFVAVAASALWAATVASYPLLGTRAPIWMSLAETVRDATWIGFLVMLLMQGMKAMENMRFSLGIAIMLGFIFTGQLLFDLILLAEGELPNLLRCRHVSAIALAGACRWLASHT